MTQEAKRSPGKKGASPGDSVALLGKGCGGSVGNGRGFGPLPKQWTVDGAGRVLCG
ncbi:hypothetical protein DPMN_065020 [Dreissena polymorpha]|uniref:Uncharacterized protein n=1 Tax=Dreissena polymorpha TaxID=45954 RepID=A0A9D4CEJ7_DREPO|nr:hypothetical protein DPMN_065020 [Dreissena polymorpha]